MCLCVDMRLAPKANYFVRIHYHKEVINILRRLQTFSIDLFSEEFHESEVHNLEKIQPWCWIEVTATAAFEVPGAFEKSQ